MMNQSARRSSITVSRLAGWAEKLLFRSRPFPAIKPSAVCRALLLRIFPALLLCPFLAVAAHAVAKTDLAVSMTTDPMMASDSNKCAVNGPHAAYVAFKFTNPSGTATLYDLEVTLGGFAAGFGLSGGQSAKLYIGKLTPGQNRVMYWHVYYPCYSASPNNSSLTLAVNDSTNTVTYVTGDVTNGTVVTANSEISAQAGGDLMSVTIGEGAVLGQLFYADMQYSFGNGSNDKYNMQPAGNTTFNAGCFGLEDTEVMASVVTGITVGTHGQLLFIGTKGGSSNYVTMRYYYRYLCMNTSTAGQAYASQGTSGMKYSSNFGTGAFDINFPTGSNPFTVTKTASPSIVPLGGTVTYTVTVSNTGSYPAMLDRFVDTLPVGMVYQGLDASSDVTAANSSHIPAAGATREIFWSGIPYTSYSVAAKSSFKLVYKVTAPSTPGSYTNSAYGQSGTVQVGSSSTPIDVRKTLSITKAFSPSSIQPGEISTMTFTLTALGVQMSDINFTDTFPSGLILATPPGAGGTCVNVAHNAVAGGNTFNVTAGTVPAAGSCTITVRTTAASAGSYSNVTSSVTTKQGTTGDPAAAAVLLVVAKPTITKAFAPATIAVGDTSTLTFTVANSNSFRISSMSFADTFPAGMEIAPTPNVGGTCTGVTSDAAAGHGYFTVSTGAVSASGSCTVTVSVKATAAGSLANTVGGVATLETGAAGTGGSATLTVLSKPTISKSFSPSTLGVNDLSTMTFTVSNSNSVRITSMSFADTFPAGMEIAPTPNVGGTCTGVTTDAAAGHGYFNVSTGAVSASGSCTVTVSVKATAAGSLANSVSGISTLETGSAGTGGSATLTVLNKPTIAKSFSPSTLGVGDLSTLTFTVSNSNSVRITSMSFTDTFPAGMEIAPTPGVGGTCTGVTTDAAAGHGYFTVSTGAVAASGSCTVTVSVKATAAGSLANSVGGVATLETGATGTGASSTLTVLNKPTIAKIFSPSTLGVGDLSTLTFTVSNSNSVRITSMSFTDTFPAGMEIAPTPNIGGTCTGVTTDAAAGHGYFTVSTGAVSASGSCTVTVSVKATAAGSLANTVGGVATLETGAAGTGASSALTVLNKPIIAKSFSPSTLGVGDLSTLTFTVSNSNSVRITSMSFTDTFPAGMELAPSPNVGGTCTGVTTDAAAGHGYFNVSTGAVAASGSCTVTVSVKATAAGSLANSVGGVATLETGAAGTGGSATLTVLNKPTIAKSFSPSTLGVGDLSTLTFTVSNSNSVRITSMSFTDTFPAGMEIAPAPGVGGTCTGVTTDAAAGHTYFNVSTGAVSASGSCTVTVSLKATAAGSLANSVGGVATLETGATGTGASSTLTVLNKPTIAKSFSPSTLGVGDLSTLTFTVSNSNSVRITSMSFTDTFPAGMELAPSPNVGGTCTGVTTDAAAGHGYFTVSTGAVSASGSCTVTVNVKATAAGSLANTVSGVATLETGAAGTGGSATLTVLNKPTIAKSFSPSTLGVGDLSTLTFTVNNSNSVRITSMSFTDTFPAGMELAPSPNVGGTCTGVTTDAAAGHGYFTVSTGAVSASGSCTVTVSVKATATGSLANSVGGVATLETGATGTGASSTLTVLNKPTIAKSFSPSTLGVGDLSTLTFTVSNSNSVRITSMSFTDTFPAGMEIAPTPGVDGTCTGVTTDAAAGHTYFNVSTGAVAASGSCTVTVSVKATAAGSLANSVSGVSTLETGSAGTGGSATLTVLNKPTIAKSFSPATLGVGDLSTLTFTVSNSNSVRITSMSFTDTFPAGMELAPSPNVGGTCTGVTTDAAAGHGYFNVSTGAVAASGSCTVTVSVKATAAGSLANTVSGVATLETGGAGTGGSATLTVLNKPTIAKSFSPSTLVAGELGTLTFTVSNPNSVRITSMSFMDSFPDGLVIAPAPGVGGTCAGVVTDAAAGSSSLSVSTGAVPAAGSCTVTVSVKANLTGSLDNYVSGVATLETGSAGAGAAATLTVLGKPAISKSFSPAALAVDDLATLTFTVSNPNSVRLTSMSFTDTFPAGLEIAPAPEVGGTCPGVVTDAAAGRASFYVSTGAVPAAGSCTVTVSVKATSAGSLENYVSGVATLETGGAGTGAGPATLTVTAGVPVSGLIYDDVNHSAAPDSGESGAGLPALFVKLTPRSGDSCTGPALQAAAADSDGRFILPGVPAGDYCLVLSLNSTLSDIAAGYPAGRLGTEAPDGVRKLGVAAAGVTGEDFGVYRGGKITGRVFRDDGAGESTANDGVQSGSEAGLSGVAVSASDGASALYDTAATDGAGNYVLWLPAGADTVKVRETNRSGYLSTGGSAGTTGGAYVRAQDAVTFTASDGGSWPGLNFADVPANQFFPDHTQSGLPGTVVFYPHTFIAGSGGEVSFSVEAASDPASAAWSEVLYRDSNCNGILDAGENQFAAGLSVTAGQKVCIILKEFIPAGAPLYADNRATLTAAFTYTDAEPALSTAASRTDLTLTGTPENAGLILNKTVDKAAALPGETLVYTIDYKNSGSGSLSSIVLHDMVPAFTGSPEACCVQPSGPCLGDAAAPLPGDIASCTAAISGATISWTLGGRLAPGAGGRVKFSVIVFETK